ncbi:Gfo/Idh/MocA family oxidoreductase [uncultured Cohaesibacter sp.]|uniref:Gfo/Idh/MocA family protein n=1 Tax=uncultured Cohaesibacter sp. TaxID=1002546 RepID=UPI0029C77EFF|nr:Gfo/Idh/MocA family oxidoreductase [uncultured Cohaesibacter sp.]
MNDTTQKIESHRKLRLGMVGGGVTAFIGGVHRIASRIDDRFTLVAGALDNDAERGKAFAVAIGIDPDRAYDDFESMIAAEAKREDKVDVISIVTPNFLHFPVAKAALEAGFHVICEKPMTTSLEDAKTLAEVVKRTGKQLFLTHTYTGYPMVRQAREMVASGEIGELRRVQVEYAQDWLAAPDEDPEAATANWRNDPKKAGQGGAIGDIGTHAYNLAAFVAGEEPKEILAELTALVPGRKVDDDAAVLMRYANGAKGTLWASQVVAGNGNNLSLRIYGATGGLEWWQENPEELWYTPLGEPRRLLRRNGVGATPSATAGSRIPVAHPEGYLEAFANLYKDAANALETGGKAELVPGADDGVAGLAFVTACLKSSAEGGVWIAL